MPKPWQSLKTWLFVQQCVQGNNKGNIRGLHFWHIMREIHQWWIDSPHKWPKMQKVFPCHDIIIWHWPLPQLVIQLFNSLAPGKFEWYLRYLIFQIISVIDGWGISWELVHRWMSLDLTDDKSTLVQVTAWCRQATSHYLSQWWPRSRSPNGDTRPQWVKGKTKKKIQTLVSH